jgi:hypothetical protein
VNAHERINGIKMVLFMDVKAINRALKEASTFCRCHGRNSTPPPTPSPRLSGERGFEFRNN